MLSKTQLKLTWAIAMLMVAIGSSWAYIEYNAAQERDRAAALEASIAKQDMEQLSNQLLALKQKMDERQRQMDQLKNQLSAH